jgi:hypothetical protein
MDVMPGGCQSPVNIIAGIGTTSDATFAVSNLLVDVHPVQPDSIRGSSGSSTFTNEGTLPSLR